MAFQKALLVRVVPRRRPKPCAQEARTAPARHAVGISEVVFSSP